MVQIKKHDRKKRRPRSIREEPVRRLLSMLVNDDFLELLKVKNAARGGLRRIERLREASTELAKLRPQVNFNLLFDESADKRGRAYQEALARSEHCEQLVDTINGLLKRYKAIQTIPSAWDGSPEWIPDYPEQSDAYKECAVALEIMFLLEKGDLARLRKCECGTYFFARSSITRFCSEKCRVAYWENSESRKEQKRKRAKEYYHLHKSGKVK